MLRHEGQSVEVAKANDPNAIPEAQKVEGGTVKMKLRIFWIKRLTYRYELLMKQSGKKLTRATEAARMIDNHMKKLEEEARIRDNRARREEQIYGKR